MKSEPSGQLWIRKQIHETADCERFPAPQRPSFHVTIKQPENFSEQSPGHPRRNHLEIEIPSSKKERKQTIIEENKIVYPNIIKAMIWDILLQRLFDEKQIIKEEEQALSEAQNIYHEKNLKKTANYGMNI